MVEGKTDSDRLVLSTTGRRQDGFNLVQSTTGRGKDGFRQAHCPVDYWSTARRIQVGLSCRLLVLGKTDSGRLVLSSKVEGKTDSDRLSTTGRGKDILYSLTLDRQVRVVSEEFPEIDRQLLTVTSEDQAKDDSFL